MLNSEDFIKRLEHLMEHFGETASSFADKIGVQRSSISHLLSGRNKPSLDFILKISQLYPELNLYWLLEGTEPFLKSDMQEVRIEKIEQPPTLFSENEIVVTAVDSPTLPKDFEPINPSPEQTVSNIEEVVSQKNTGRSVQKIVFFYSDGTFDDYHPAKPK